MITYAWVNNASPNQGAQLLAADVMFS